LLIKRGEKEMRRTASEIIHDLQSRVARLEKSAALRHGGQTRTRLNTDTEVFSMFFNKYNNYINHDMSEYIIDTLEGLLYGKSMGRHQIQKAKDYLNELPVDSILSIQEYKWFDEMMNFLEDNS
jgi:hypothetical protein